MRAVHLSRLDSRPAKPGLGRYVFFIDNEGSAQRDLPVSAAITAIEQPGVADVPMLGAYAVMDPSACACSRISRGQNAGGSARRCRSRSWS